MNSGYLLDDVRVSVVSEPRKVNSPLYQNDTCKVSREAFSMVVPGTGRFYAAHGNEVEYVAEQGADPDWVRLYLNGQVLVALLHQRKIINFHASSFVYDGRGVMILGETGAGKSSLTLSFALRRGGFLTDDLTPVVFNGTEPSIMLLQRKVKIRKDTAVELGIDSLQLTEAEAGTGKKYFSIGPVQVDPFPLNLILKTDTGPVDAPVFSTPEPADKFALLRSEVCSWEILAGMPETEESYLHQILDIVQKVKIFRVTRPEEIRIAQFHEVVRDFLMRQG